MLFTNAEFGVFYILVFAAYWLLRKERIKAQNLLILVASYVFYGWWDWRFLSLIFLSSLVDYVCSIRIDETEDQRTRKIWMWVSVVFNLGMLGFFKYYNFFVDSFIEMFAAFGVTLHARTLNIILPVGISFYTFQTMSYTLDVYRRQMKASKDLMAFLAYVSFFPQLVAGPIERAKDLLPQFFRERTFDLVKAKDGLRQMLWGLFKKVVIADSAGEALDALMPYYDQQPGIMLFMLLWFFTVQLYCDFSGYSDIAIGTARMMGFTLSKNFDYPFFSRDILDFWRRWHLTLTSFFRDYLYMGLSNFKLVRKKHIIIRNFLITFAVSGLWHGANWTFVIWGLLHGLFQIPFILFPGLRTDNRRLKPPFNFRGTLVATVQIIFTNFLNTFAIVFFLSPSVGFAFDYLKRTFSPSLFQMPHAYKWLAVVILTFFAVERWAMLKGKVFPLQLDEWPRWVRWTIYYALVLLILYYNYERRTFLYFQF